MLSEVDDILKDLLNKCKMIEPEYLPIVAPVDYDDHTKLIVVWCPGGAVRRYRNRRIGDFLKELHLTEGRNTGIRKILNALEKNGSPLPEFITDEDHSYFITRLFIREGFYDLTDVNDVVNEVANDVVNEIESSAPETSKLIRSLSDSRKKKAIKTASAIIKDPRKTIQQIADDTGVSKSTAERYLREFQSAGVLKREGSDKSGKWILLSLIYDDVIGIDDLHGFSDELREQIKFVTRNRGTESE